MAGRLPPSLKRRSSLACQVRRRSRVAPCFHRIPALCHPPLPNISGHFAHIPLSLLTSCHQASPALFGPYCFSAPLCPLLVFSLPPLIVPVLPPSAPLLNLQPVATSSSFRPRITFCHGERDAIVGSPVSASPLILIRP